MAAQEQASAKIRTGNGIAGAGAGGGLGLNAPGFSKVKHFAAGGSKKNGPIIPDELPQCWAKILDDNSPTCFLLTKYSANGKQLELVTSGPDEGSPGGCGLNMMREALLANTESCGWGAFRINAVDNRQNTISKRPKLIFVQWMAPGASAMRKAKMGPHKGCLKEILYGAHCDVLVEDVEADLDTTALVSLLQAATGAHKPNGYEFNEGDVTEADYYKDIK